MAYRRPMMFVKYSPKTPHMKVIPLIPVKAGSEGYNFDNDTVTLRPGTNELTDEEWAAIQPHVKDQIGNEIIPFSVPVKTGADGQELKAKTLKDVPVATARKIIQDCQDPKTLKKWFNQELPDELLLVLSKRMRKLKIEPEDLEDDDIDLDLKDDITPEGNTGDEETTSEDSDTVKGGRRRRKKRTQDGKGNDDPLEDDDDEIPDFDGSGGGINE
jgi:hypothetical protein